MQVCACDRGIGGGNAWAINPAMTPVNTSRNRQWPFRIAGRIDMDTPVRVRDNGPVSLEHYRNAVFRCEPGGDACPAAARRPCQDRSSLAISPGCGVITASVLSFLRIAVFPEMAFSASASVQEAPCYLPRFAPRSALLCPKRSTRVLSLPRPFFPCV